MSNVTFNAPEEATALATFELAAVATISGAFANAFSPTSTMFVGIVNLLNDSQPLNALLPILVTPGQRTAFNEVHPSNADSGISVIYLPN